MKINRLACLFMLSMLLPAAGNAQQRQEMLLEKGWKFTREDNKGFSQSQWDDKKWQNVTVPHDWAIYGPFSIENDKQHTAIAQDGQTAAMEHAGRTGGLPFVGVGWYRTTFSTPQMTKGGKCILLFDGAMSHARVYVNGKEAGYWPYGYNAFQIDATPYLNADGKNVLAVRLENETESSRWYPGAGLYRNVRVIVTGDAYVPVWGTHLTTPVVKKEYAKVCLATSLEMPEGKKLTDYTIVTELKDADGKVVAQGKQQGKDPVIDIGHIFRVRMNEKHGERGQDRCGRAELSGGYRDFQQRVFCLYCGVRCLYGCILFDFAGYEKRPRAYGLSAGRGKAAD